MVAIRPLTGLPPLVQIHREIAVHLQDILLIISLTTGEDGRTLNYKIKISLCSLYLTSRD